METVEELKEELKYLAKECNSQFDIIDSLYGTLISVALKKELTPSQLNTVRKAYEMLGGDTWEPEIILRKVTIVEDLKKEIDDLKKEIEDLKKENEDLKKEIESQYSIIDTLYETIGIE